MRPIDEHSLRRSIEASERRRADARARRERQARLLKWGLVLVTVLIILFVVARGWQARSQHSSQPPISGSSPTQTSNAQATDASATDASASDAQAVDSQLPRVVVSWPQFDQSLTLSPAPPADNGMARIADHVVLWPGRPLTVSVENTMGWELEWSGEGVQGQDEKATWEATGSGGATTLVLKFRPSSSGSAGVEPGTGTGQTGQIELIGLVPRPVGYRRQTLDELGSAKAWITPHVAVQGEPAPAWDERAVTLLHDASVVAPSRAGFNNELTETTAAPECTIVSSFDGSTPSKDSDKNATFAALNPDYVNSKAGTTPLETLALFMARRYRDASIKIVVPDLATSGVSNPQPVIRLAFDGSGARDGWIRGADKTVTYKWWEKQGAE